MYMMILVRSVVHIHLGSPVLGGELLCLDGQLHPRDRPYNHLVPSFSCSCLTAQEVRRIDGRLMNVIQLMNFIRRTYSGFEKT